MFLFNHILVTVFFLYSRPSKICQQIWDHKIIFFLVVQICCKSVSLCTQGCSKFISYFMIRNISFVYKICTIMIERFLVISFCTQVRSKFISEFMITRCIPSAKHFTLLHPGVKPVKNWTDEFNVSQTICQGQKESFFC